MKTRNYNIEYLEELNFLLKDVKKASYNLIPNSVNHMTILDIGCGDGSDCRKIADLTPKSAKIFGLDNSDLFIKNAQKLTSTVDYPNISYILGDAEELPFNENTIDCIRFERVFQHLVSPQNVIDEVHRIINKTNGKLIIIETDWLSVTFGTKYIDEERAIIDEKVEHDVNNGLASRFIPDYALTSNLKICSISNHVTSINSLKKSDYVFGLNRNIERLMQRTKKDYSFFVEYLKSQEKIGSFSFTWNTKTFEISPSGAL